MKIRLAGPLQSDSIVDGKGIRTVIWTQGCSHNCKGCHNPQTHDFNSGIEVDIDEIKMQLDNIKNQDGITLSGGDPFFQVEASGEIAKYSKKKGLNVWCYTGYTFEELLNKAQKEEKLKEFLDNIDVLVDGKFEQEQKSLNLQFKGSRNQRIIDVKESLNEKKVIEIEELKEERTYKFEIKKQKGIFI